jgi:hypothetical protein
MLSLVGRLFLLLLLALDWAADPALLAPAVALLASPWGSTENVCPSGGYQRDVLRQCRPERRPAPAAYPSATPASRPGRPRPASRPSRGPAPVGPVYVFMSIRR